MLGPQKKRGFQEAYSSALYIYIFTMRIHLKLYHGLYGFIVFVVVNSNTWLNMMWLIYLTGWWFGT